MYVSGFICLITLDLVYQNNKHMFYLLHCYLQFIKSFITEYIMPYSPRTCITSQPTPDCEENLVFQLNYDT